MSILEVLIYSYYQSELTNKSSSGLEWLWDVVLSFIQLNIQVTISVTQVGDENFLYTDNKVKKTGLKKPVQPKPTGPRAPAPMKTVQKPAPKAKKEPVEPVSINPSVKS